MGSNRAPGLGKYLRYSTLDQVIVRRGLLLGVGDSHLVILQVIVRLKVQGEGVKGMEATASTVVDDCAR